MLRSLLLTSEKSQVEMRSSIGDRLSLLEDTYQTFLDAKEDTKDCLEVGESLDLNNGMKIQQSGRVYKKLLKRGVLNTKYHYRNR